jgi:hypothetical protein
LRHLIPTERPAERGANLRNGHALLGRLIEQYTRYTATHRESRAKGFICVTYTAAFGESLGIRLGNSVKAEPTAENEPDRVRSQRNHAGTLAVWPPLPHLRGLGTQ